MGEWKTKYKALRRQWEDLVVLYDDALDEIEKAKKALLRLSAIEKRVAAQTGKIAELEHRAIDIEWGAAEELERVRSRSRDVTAERDAYKAEVDNWQHVYTALVLKHADELAQAKPTQEELEAIYRVSSWAKATYLHGAARTLENFVKRHGYRKPLAEPGRITGP